MAGAELEDLTSLPRSIEGVEVGLTLRQQKDVYKRQVQNGTLHKGDCLIAGTAVGRVRPLRNDKGQEITEAGPSTPV